MNKSVKLNKLIYSVVALVLTVVLLIATSFSWVMSNFTSNVKSNDYIQISADAGLEMNYGDKDNNQGTINIENVQLTECSSVDGRNFFFPTSDYASIGDGEFASSVNTKDLVFREGTANDINKKYISVDFTLSSQNDTSVWLSTDSRIECRNTETNTPTTSKTANAIRIAFVENKIGGKTTIFDNSTSIEYAEKNSAVKAVSQSGEVNPSETCLETCNVRSFNEFTYDNADQNTLFDIEAGETLNVTMNIWLEGTDKDCTSSVLNLSDLQILLKFTTSYEEVRTIYFIDQTLEKWVANDNCYVFAIDDSGYHHRMQMSANYETDHTWSVGLSEGTEKIRFVRYNPTATDTDEKEWNYWEAGTLGKCTTYVAFGHSAGMWSENFQGTTITLFDGTASGFLTNKDDNGNDTVMHVAFSVTDGNDVTQEFDYKLSYQYEKFRWQIVIPSVVNEISFYRYDITEKTQYNKWENTVRGDNLYYTATASGTGYWSNKLLYLDGEGYKSGATFVSYFYGNNTVWTAMRSTTDNGRYVAAVPSGSTGVVLMRYNSSATEFAWGSNVYNQTPNNLENFGTNNLFTITGWTGDNNSQLDGTWSSEKKP